MATVGLTSTEDYWDRGLNKSGLDPMIIMTIAVLVEDDGDTMWAETGFAATHRRKLRVWDGFSISKGGARVDSGVGSRPIALVG